MQMEACGSGDLAPLPSWIPARQRWVLALDGPFKSGIHMELGIRPWSHRWLPTSGLTVIVALAAHVPAMAQMGVRTTPGGSSDSGLNVERIAVPFAGTYAVTLTLGQDTARIFFRTAADAELRTVIAPDPRPGSGPGATAVPGLSLLVYADPDIEALPYSEDGVGRLHGVLVAPIDSGDCCRWQLGHLFACWGRHCGRDCAARLSRLLLEVRAQRAVMEGRCSDDPSAANRSAARAHQSPVCDEETSLPCRHDSSLEMECCCSVPMRWCGSNNESGPPRES